MGLSISCQTYSLPIGFRFPLCFAYLLCFPFREIPVACFRPHLRRQICRAKRGDGMYRIATREAVHDNFIRVLSLSHLPISGLMTT